MAESRLNVLVGAKIQGLTQGLKKAKRSLRKFERNTAAMGRTLTTNLTAPMLGFAAVSIKAFDQQAKAEAGLRTALGQNEQAFRSLTEQAKELQKITLFGDEETIAAQTMLATMGLEEDAIKRLIPLVQDMATAKGMNLKAAADLVAKSVGSSTNALSRYGITIEGAVGSTDRLDSAVSSLSTMFKGQAEASALAGAGAFTQLKNSMMDFAEEVGKALMPMLKPLKKRLQEATDRLSELSTAQITAKIKTALFVGAIGPVLIVLSKLASAFQVILGIIPKLITGLRLLAVAVVSNPLGALVTVLGLAAGYMFTFGSSTNKAKKDLDNFNKTGTTTAERLKEINDQLERSTKTELELIKEEAAARQKEIFEEMGTLSHLATESLAELQKEYDKWGDVIKKATQQQKDNASALEDQKNKLLELQVATSDYVKLVPSIAEQWGLTFEPMNTAITTITESTRTMGQVMFEQLDGIVDAAMTTKDSFKVFAGQVIQQMVRMIAKAIILAALLSVIFPGSATGGASFMKNFGNLMQGGGMFEGKAVGGFASAGTPYLVGEHGPELFTPSGSSGGHISSASQTANMMNIPDVRISGEDLLIVFDRANRHRNSLG
jgi:hypothetical protein